MRYIKFEGGTGFCGCDFTEFHVFEDSAKDSVLDDMAAEYARDNGESYLDIERFYSIYREDFDSEEEYKDAYYQAEEDYFGDCYCDWTELTREEYLEEGGVE